MRIRRLRGGTQSATHAVDVRSPQGAIFSLVLRRHVRRDVIEHEPSLAEREANHLRLLTKSNISAPSLVAVDPNGAEAGVPALLMTFMPGRLVVRPADLDSWLYRMAQLLPPIHAIDPGGVPVHAWEIWDDIRNTEPPGWTRQPRMWEDLIRIAQGPWPDYPKTFVHRDFQHYNVLWVADRPSAIVDWVEASIGPKELDFDHFRYNLLGDFGFDVAQRFLAVYREVTGHEPNAFWEALNFANHGTVKPSQVDDYDAYVASLLERL